MGFQHTLFKSVLWRGLLYLSQLLLNIFIARYYEAADSGWIFYNLNNYAFVILVLGVCLDSGMGYFLASNKIKPGKLFSLSLLWVVLAAGLCLLFLFVYPYQPETGKGLYYAGSLAFMTGSLLISFFSALFFARKNFSFPNIILLAVNVAVLLIFFVTKEDANAFLNRNNFLYIYIFSFLAQGVLLAFFFYTSYAKEQSLTLPSQEEFKGLLRYSLLVMTGNVINFLVFRSDYWFIDYFNRPAAELGNYIQVSKLSQLFFAIPTFLASAVFPISAAGEEGITHNLKTLSRILAFAMLIACGVLIATGAWLFPLLFGEGFDQMYIPFVLLVPGIIAVCLAYPMSAYFAGRNKIMINLYASLFAFLFIATGNSIFIPLYGIKAAAAVSSAGYIVLFVYLLQHFRKENYAPLRDFLWLHRTDLEWIKTLFKKDETGR